MRYGMSILALVAVLAVGVQGHALNIAWREGGGTYEGITYTDVTCDDAYLNCASNSEYNYNTANLLMEKSTYPNKARYQVLLGWAEMFDLVPRTSGGLSIVIDNAVIKFRSDLNGVQEPSDNYTCYRMATDWLLTTAGENENNISYDEMDMTNHTPWATGVLGNANGQVEGFSALDYTAEHAVVQPWGIPKANQARLPDLDVTQLMQDIYDNGTNGGFTFRQDGSPLYSSLKFKSSETTSADSAPALLMEYHYVPEPGTLMLLGTGALGLIGYMRRRRMR